MAPYLVFANNLTSTDFRVWYEQLNASYSEGIILGYALYYREVEEHMICTIYNNCTAMNVTFCVDNSTCIVGVTCEANVTTCDVINAGLFTNYTVSVAAVTSAGAGPFSDSVFVRTDSFGKFVDALVNTR